MGRGPDDSGQLSLDFLVGFSIFMLTLIVASTMLSGVLVGLQSKKIDYDAVAYRTGVILVEDPGEPNAFPNVVTIDETDQWEFIQFVQKDQVLRFGMSQYKSSPKILAPQKIDSFFNRTIYPDLSDYRERIIFGDYPYNFNVTLQTIPGGTVRHVGDPYPANSPYGYIRRVVQVKEPSHSIINMTNYYEPLGGSGQFDVNINFSELLDYETRGPKYWVDPLKERVSFNLTNVSGMRNLATGAPKVILNSVRLYFLSVDLAGVESYTPLPGTLYLTIDGVPRTSSTLPPAINNSISMEFPPSYFIQPSKFTSGDTSAMKIRFQFDPSTANVSDIARYQVEWPPSAVNYTPPTLEPAVLEVRIW
ncbi:MAG TPA: hypothetical protein VMW63_06820 [Methanoregulaceae archaeon]|nr:hypothetical protein [Methanoregulaceae archaeon]